MVGVHESRQDNVPSLQVQGFIGCLGQFGGCTHLFNDMVANEQCAVGNFAAGRIHCDEGMDVVN
jgi:hypothetical protein